MGDALLAACIPPAVAVGTGYALYKVIPELFYQIREMLANHFYKTVYVTLSQNKVKFVRLIAFMSKFKVERDCKAVIIASDDAEYEVPLLEIRVTSDGLPEIAMKVHTDNSFNITYIEISVYKRDFLSYNENKIEKFDGFMKQFPSHVKKQDSIKQLEGDVPKIPVKQEHTKQLEGCIEKDRIERLEAIRKACQAPPNSPTVDPKSQPTVNLRNGNTKRPPRVVTSTDLRDLRNRFAKIGADAEGRRRVTNMTLTGPPGTDAPVRKNPIVPMGKNPNGRSAQPQQEHKLLYGDDGAIVRVKVRPIALKQNSTPTPQTDDQK